MGGSLGVPSLPDGTSLLARPQSYIVLLPLNGGRGDYMIGGADGVQKKKGSGRMLALFTLCSIGYSISSPP